MELVLQVVVGTSAIATASAAVGCVRYVRQAASDAGKAVTLLEGTAASDGLIERVEDVEEETEQNTERTARNRRVLRREGLLNDTHNNAD